MYENQKYSEDSIKLIQSYYRLYYARKIFKTRVKMNSKRKNVASELLQTEREYTNNLQILIQSFLRPIVKNNAKIVEQQMLSEFSRCLSGIERIFAFHQELLVDIEKSLQDWGPRSILGANFVQMAFYLKSYTQYVNHYQNVVQMLAKKKADKQLQTFLDGLKPQQQGKGIKDYMIMPVQRIPRYEMLLIELIRGTWEDHADYQNLISAHAKVKEITVTIENNSADALSIAKVMELAGSFLQFKLVVPHRRYIDDIPCSVVLQEGLTAVPLQIFLFNDLILWAKPKKDKYSIKHLVYINESLEITYPTASCDAFIFVGNGRSIQMTIDTEFISKWTQFIKVTCKKGKVWLPHDSEKDSDQKSFLTITSSQTQDAPVPKKKRISLHRNFFAIKKDEGKGNKEDKKGKDSDKITASASQGSDLPKSSASTGNLLQPQPPQRKSKREDRLNKLKLPTNSFSADFEGQILTKNYHNSDINDTKISRKENSDSQAMKDIARYLRKNSDDSPVPLATSLSFPIYAYSNSLPFAISDAELSRRKNVLQEIRTYKQKTEQLEKLSQMNLIPGKKDIEGKEKAKSPRSSIASSISVDDLRLHSIPLRQFSSNDPACPPGSDPLSPRKFKDELLPPNLPRNSPRSAPTPPPRGLLPRPTSGRLIDSSSSVKGQPSKLYSDLKDQITTYQQEQQQTIRNKRPSLPNTHSQSQLAYSHPSLPHSSSASSVEREHLESQELRELRARKPNSLTKEVKKSREIKEDDLIELNQQIQSAEAANSEPKMRETTRERRNREFKRSKEFKEITELIPEFKDFKDSMGPMIPSSVPSSPPPPIPYPQKKDSLNNSSKNLKKLNVETEPVSLDATCKPRSPRHSPRASPRGSHSMVEFSNPSSSPTEPVQVTLRAKSARKGRKGTNSREKLQLIKKQSVDNATINQLIHQEENITGNNDAAIARKKRGSKGKMMDSEDDTIFQEEDSSSNQIFYRKRQFARNFNAIMKDRRDNLDRGNQQETTDNFSVRFWLEKFEDDVIIKLPRDPNKSRTSESDERTEKTEKENKGGSFVSSLEVKEDNSNTSTESDLNKKKNRSPKGISKSTRGPASTKVNVPPLPKFENNYQDQDSSIDNKEGNPDGVNESSQKPSVPQAGVSSQNLESFAFSDIIKKFAAPSTSANAVDSQQPPIVRPRRGTEGNDTSVKLIVKKFVNSTNNPAD